MTAAKKIRTYNFPQDRITDQRSALTLYGIEHFMKGEAKFIDRFAEAMD